MPLNKHIENMMIVDGATIGIILLREDQVDYFNITKDEVPAPERRQRAAHRRRLFKGRLDQAESNATVNVGATYVEHVYKKQRKLPTGKPIKIPTELTSQPVSQTGAANPRSSIRMTVIRFPGNATNHQIARWINTKFTANKPTYFYTPSGSTYPVNVPASATPPANTAP